MLQRVTMEGIELPRLYIAEDQSDAELAMSKGIPFVKWTKGKDELIRCLLLPTLKKMFPHIKWYDIFDVRQCKSTFIKYPGTTSTNTKKIDEDFHAGTDHLGDSVDLNRQEDFVAPLATTLNSIVGTNNMSYEDLPLEVYVGDMSSYVNLDVLQNLHLMPQFIGDILDCIKTNSVAPTIWSEGWNKKKAASIGNFDRASELPNLIILDVSHSIPVGISATMLMLIDTLRTQVHADVIITGSKSRFYKYGTELPTPQAIRNTIQRCNESAEFMAILRDHIAGKHYNHVISFGDNDSPSNCGVDAYPPLGGTIVEEVHHYHTWCKDTITGYAVWCHELQTKPKAHYDTSWCCLIDKTADED